MRYFWLSLTAAVIMFLVNINGFIDTLTNSALGCGRTYPLCNGKFLPDFNDYHSVIEYTHRIFVGLAGTLLFVVSAMVWFRYKTRRMKWLVAFAIIGVLAESILGALTVIMPLSHYLLAAHLGTALISFAALCNMTYAIFQEEKNIQYLGDMPSSFSKFSWFTFIFLYAAIYFGGFVAKTGSGGAFRGYPFPTESFQEVGNAFWIDVFHRLFALCLIILLLLLIRFAKKYRGIRPDLYRISIICFVLIIFQGLSGALLIYTHLSLGSVLVHVSFLSLLVGLLSIICIQSGYKNNEVTK
jgi:heme a synthase